MIRYQNLQILDYVLIDGKIRRIEAITKRKVGYHIKPEDQLHYARLQDIFPIKITEELLLKLGFWKSPKYKNIFECRDYQPKFPYEWSATYAIGDGTLLLSRTRTYDPMLGADHPENNTIFPFASCTIVVTHLHELQHAFRLCGIKFEIKLKNNLE